MKHLRLRTATRDLKFGLMALAGAIVLAQVAPADERLPELSRFTVTSSLDGTSQPSLLWVPPAAESRPTPLFVFVHSWSSDYRQPNDKWQREAVARGWIYLHPNFRGINEQPEAGGSRLARQDIIDAVDHVLARHKVDTSRVYLAGTSGGGHMAMLMAGYYPRRFTAVSAWVGISDLAEWERFHQNQPTRYSLMIRACCGGLPGASAQVDAQYRERSPIFHLQNVGDLPLDLNAGVFDGHTGSVPIAQTLRAFNVVATAGRHETVTDAEIEQLWTRQKLDDPKASDRVEDASYERALLLRREAGPARVTIFDGTHEGLPGPACAWLSKQQRATVGK